MRIIDYTYSSVNTCRIYLGDLGLGLFYMEEIAGKVRALRQSSALIKHHVAVKCLLDARFYFVKFFLLLWVFSFVVSLCFCCEFFILQRFFAFLVSFCFCCCHCCFFVVSVFYCEFLLLLWVFYLSVSFCFCCEFLLLLWVFNFILLQVPYFVVNFFVLAVMGLTRD